MPERVTENRHEIQGMIYPWNQKSWERFIDSVNNERVPHAIILTGAEGVGKHAFAMAMAERLLCTQPQESGLPCGHCQHCHLLKACTHPDFLHIQPEEPGKAIRIDVIREFTSHAGLTSKHGGYKVIVLEPADAMNTEASNSLLKTLEEPVSRTVMILVTSQPNRLLPTIRSRCRIISFPIPDRANSLAWIESKGINKGEGELLMNLASGSPLIALEFTDPEQIARRNRMLKTFIQILNGKGEPVSTANEWIKFDYPQTIKCMYGWLIDLIRLKMDPNCQHLTNSDRKSELQGVAGKSDIKALYRLLDKITLSVRALGSTLNQQMQLEELLLLAMTVTKYPPAVS